MLNRQQDMSTRNLLLLLVIFMAQHLDMGVSRPTSNGHSGNCQWHNLKHLTQNLYHQAQRIYDSTNSSDNKVHLDDIPRIQCHHHCGPDNLAHPKTCLKRIFHVLSYYKSVLSNLPNNSQNEDFTKAKEIISHILDQLRDCDYKDINLPTPHQVPDYFLKMKIGAPLLSVSIHIARVFSPGNPAHHTMHPRH